MGFELMSSAGGNIKNPKRDVPKMIILAGAAILAVYMFATFGILASIKTEDVSIVTGIVDALKLMFDEVLGGASWLFNIAVVALLFTFFGNMVTWSIGANQTISATGLDDTAPGVFGHVNKRFGTPDYAFVLMGIIATAITILAYVLDPNQTSVFWTLFALSSIVFLMPYLLMFPALLVLRHKHPDQPRPYVIPGGKAGRVDRDDPLRGRHRAHPLPVLLLPGGGRVEGRVLADHRRWHDRLTPHRLVALPALQPQERRRGVRHRERRSRIEGTAMAATGKKNGKTVVVALGGNAILQPGQVGTFEEQLFNIDGAMRRIAAAGRGRLARRAHARQRPPGRQPADPERARGKDGGADADGRLRRR